MKTPIALFGRAKHQDKFDIYDFGVILLELITGKPINSRDDEDAVKDEVVSELDRTQFCLTIKAHDFYY